MTHLAAIATTQPRAASAATLLQIPALAELAQLDQWVAWKYIKGKDKCSKVPFNVNTRKPADHSNPTDWLTWHTCWNMVQDYDGVGVVFSAADPYSGVDLDGCRNPATGEITRRARKIIRRVNSYTEISPSGTGVKIWVRGTLPDAVQVMFGPHVGVEVYSQNRYFCVTGQHLPGTPTTINDAQPALTRLAAVVQRYKRRTKRPTTTKQPSTAIQPRVSPGERAAGRMVATDTIARANQDHDLGDLLESYGATLVSVRGTSRFYSGLRGDNHSNAQTYSIIPSRNGGYIGHSYSPNGALNNVDFRRGFDWFAAYTDLAHAGNRVAALKALTPEQPKRAASRPPHPADEVDYRTQAQDKDAARKRTQRAEATRQKLATIETRLRADDTLSERAMLLASYLLDLSNGKHLQVAPTNEQIATAIGWESERTVQRAFRDLEAPAAHYGARKGGRGGLNRPNVSAIWTWGAAVHRVTAQTTQNDHYGKCVTLVYIEHDLLSESGACEGGGDQRPAVDLALAAFDCYEPIVEYDVCGFDLDLLAPLVVVEAAQTPPPSQAPDSQLRPVDIETDAPVGECASFDALAARVPRGEYTGGIKRLASSETRYTWLEWASQHYRAMHPQPESSENSAPPVEQHELDDGRAASVPTGKACKVKHAKYRAVVGLMSSLELARELGDLQRLLKHAVPSAEQKRGKIAAEEWAKTLCEKLAIVDAQIDLCDLPSQHPPAFNAKAVVVAGKPVEQPHNLFTQVQQPATPRYDAPGLAGRLHALKAVATVHYR